MVALKVTVGWNMKKAVELRAQRRGQAQAEVVRQALLMELMDELLEVMP